MSFSRREFIKASALLAASRSLGAQDAAPAAPLPCPGYLRAHEALFRQSPRAASLAWYRDAAFGLFVHYNNTSLLPGSKADPMPAGVTIDSLSRRFTAENFDAAFIADLAVSAGMRYLCWTPYHGGGPYLFRTAAAGPTSLELPARRDLTAEIARACRERDLGLFLYVHASISPSHDAVRARNRALLRDLATQYGPIAGWWFDTSSHARKNPDQYPRLQETYDFLRAPQPQSLISFCEGVNGDEDYVTFEHQFRQLEGYKSVSAKHVRRMRGKPVEICATLQLNEKYGKGTKMWFNVDWAYHRSADEAWHELATARGHGANLLLNIGPRGDGSVHPTDVATLRAVGERIRKEGLPATGSTH